MCCDLIFNPINCFIQNCHFDAVHSIRLSRKSMCHSISFSLYFRYFRTLSFTTKSMWYGVPFEFCRAILCLDSHLDFGSFAFRSFLSIFIFARYLLLYNKTYLYDVTISRCRGHYYYSDYSINSNQSKKWKRVFFSIILRHHLKLY